MFNWLTNVFHKFSSPQKKINASEELNWQTKKEIDDIINLNGQEKRGYNNIKNIDWETKSARNVMKNLESQTKKEFLVLYKSMGDHPRKKILIEDYLKREKEHGGGSSSSPVSSP